MLKCLVYKSYRTAQFSTLTLLTIACLISSDISKQLNEIKIFAQAETCMSNDSISPFFEPRRSKTLISHGGWHFNLNYWTLRRFRPGSNKYWLKQRLNVFS